jgi:uncharacterized protein YfaT (DUF1175 family)
MTDPYSDGVSRWHNYDLRPWYRCEQPERQTDPVVRWHYDDCAGCRFGVELLLRHYPGDTHVQWLAYRLGAS